MNTAVWVAIIAGFAVLVLVAALDLRRVIRRVAAATTPAGAGAALVREMRMSWVDVAGGAGAAICGGAGWLTDLRPDAAVWWIVGGLGLGALWAANTWWARRRALMRIARARPTALPSSAPPAAHEASTPPVAASDPPAEADSPSTPAAASGSLPRLGEVGRLIVFAAILGAGVVAFELASRDVVPSWAAASAFVVFVALAAGSGLIGRGSGHLLRRLRAR